jgi:membrane protein involved in colicin uptake
MLDSRDNSVLKSLKELRKQEEDRVKKERSEAEARADSERRAKEDAERKTKDAADHAKREEEDRIRRAVEEKEAREREERIRVEESERRARIEAETHLQQERMRLEAQVKTAVQAKKTPVGAIVGIVAVVLLIAGGIIYKIKSDHEKQRATDIAARESERETEKRRLAEQERKMELLEASFKKQIAEAKSDAERLAIQKQYDDAKRSHSSGTSAKAAGKTDKKDPGSASTPAPALIKTKKAVSDDPLDGLKL